MKRILAFLALALVLWTLAPEADQGRFRIRKRSAAAAGGTNDYFDTLCARGDVYDAAVHTGTATLYPNQPRCYSMRPDAAATSQSDPDWRYQLDNANSGYRNNSSNLGDTTVRVTYDYAGDTDANKQDAAKVVIPQWGTIGTLDGAMDASTTTLLVAMTDSGTTSQCNASRSFKVDSEVMTITTGSPRCDGANDPTVTRGTFGTTAASHSSGAVVSMSFNSLPTQVRFPVYTDGATNHTYLFTWDTYYTSSFIGPYTESIPNKNFQLSSGGTGANPGDIWLEPQVHSLGGQAGISDPATYNASVHAGAIQIRTYNADCGAATWTSADSNKLGPNAKGETLRPVGATCSDATTAMTNKWPVATNKWTRWWVKLVSQTNDYDLVSVWIADEDTEAVLIVDGLQVSQITAGTPAVANAVYRWWIEFNSSKNEITRSDFRDLVVYVKNLVVLEDPADISTLIQTKPVGG